jgi:hypothetical protein
MTASHVTLFEKATKKEGKCVKPTSKQASQAEKK